MDKLNMLAELLTAIKEEELKQEELKQEESTESEEELLDLFNFLCSKSFCDEEDDEEEYDEEYEDDMEEEYEDEFEKELSFIEVVEAYEQGFKGCVYDEENNIYKFAEDDIMQIDRENKTVYHHAPLASKLLRKKFKKEKQYISAGEAVNKLIGGNTVYFDYELQDKTVKGKAYYCTIQQSMVTEFFNHSISNRANLFAVTMKILFHGTWYI